MRRNRQKTWSTTENATDGEPKRFQAQGDQCKIIKVITVDAKGDPTTMHRLDIPKKHYKETLLKSVRLTRFYII